LLTHFKISEAEWVELIDEAGNQNGDDWDEFIIEKDEKELDSLRNAHKPKLRLGTLLEIVRYRK
jgi:hypothetical protein